jgi:hypothetical protein
MLDGFGGWRETGLRRVVLAPGGRLSEPRRRFRWSADHILGHRGRARLRLLGYAPLCRGLGRSGQWAVLLASGRGTGLSRGQRTVRLPARGGPCSAAVRFVACRAGARRRFTEVGRWSRLRRGHSRLRPEWYRLGRRGRRLTRPATARLLCTGGARPGRRHLGSGGFSMIVRRRRIHLMRGLRARPGRPLADPIRCGRCKLKVDEPRWRRLALPVDVIRRRRMPVGEPVQALSEIGPCSRF